jgi:hypothetical protein
MLRHPFCAGQVAVECTSCAVMLPLGIDMKHELCHLAPARTLRVRIEHAQIGDDMLFVVDREHGIRWRNIGNVWICRWFFHERVIERIIPTPADLADLL